MTRINFEIADLLIRQVDEAVLEKGFANRSEFFRYLVIEFMERNRKAGLKGSSAPLTITTPPSVSTSPSASVAEQIPERLINSKEKEIAEAERKLDEIVAREGLEFGIPSEAVAQIFEIVALKKEEHN